MTEQLKNPEDFIEGVDLEQFLRLLWNAKLDVKELADFTNLLCVEEDSLYIAQMCVRREAQFFEKSIQNLKEALGFNFSDITFCFEIVFDMPMERILVAENQDFCFALWWSTTA